jgi:NitT/TauT family transport system substrate-binding protein
MDTCLRAVARLSLVLFGLAAACAAPAAPSAPGPSGQTERIGAPVAASPVAAPAAPPALPPETTVRIGLHTPMSNAGFFIALERGYVAEQGLRLEVEPLDTAAKMIAPLSNGQLDVGAGAINPAVYNAVARGVDLRIVADKGNMGPGFGYTALVTRRDLWDSGAVRQLADLRGRTFAVLVPGGDAEIALDVGLAPAGSSSADVNIVPLPFPDMVQALANGSIDGAAPSEPFATEAVQRGAAVILERMDTLLPNHQVGVVFYAPQFVQENPAAGRRLMIAYLRGVRDYLDVFTRRDSAKREDVIATLIKHSTVKDRAVYDQMVVPGFNPNGQLNLESMERQQAWYLAHGLQTAPADVNSLIDYSFVRYAVEQLGEY